MRVNCGGEDVPGPQGPSAKSGSGIPEKSTVTLRVGFRERLAKHHPDRQCRAP